MHIQPYLFLEGRCEEAIAFYQKAVAAEQLTLMRYKSTPDGNPVGAANGEKILHASIRIGESTVMLSDGHCSGKPVFQGFALTLTYATDAEAEKIFHALADGGKVTQPLIKTFFASLFGMAQDRFGVTWMVLAAPKSKP